MVESNTVCKIITFFCINLNKWQIYAPKSQFFDLHRGLCFLSSCMVGRWGGLFAWLFYGVWLRKWVGLREVLVRCDFVNS